MSPWGSLKETVKLGRASAPVAKPNDCNTEEMSVLHSGQRPEHTKAFSRQYLSILCEQQGVTIVSSPSITRHIGQVSGASLREKSGVSARKDKSALQNGQLLVGNFLKQSESIFFEQQGTTTVVSFLSGLKHIGHSSPASPASASLSLSDGVWNRQAVLAEST